MTPRRFPKTAAFLLVLVFSACLGEAEHSNPLDPASDEFEKVGRIEGTTTRFYPPFNPIDDAEVRLSPGPFLATSDSEGRFVLDGIPVGEYRLAAAKEGFASDDQTVRVELGTTTGDVQVRMNGLPVLQQVRFRSTRVSRWYPPDDLFLLEVSALVEDADGLGDIDRTWFEISGRGFVRDLTETAVAGRYEIALPSDSLPGASLYGLQGEEMALHVEDDAGFRTSSGPHFVVRVIDYTPVAVSPQGQENVGTSTPTLTWEDAALPYDYTYRIDIVHDQANVQTLVRTIEGVGPDRTSYSLETPLPSGTYFWTISVVDSHGNRSRSKEAGFIIPQ